MLHHVFIIVQNWFDNKVNVCNLMCWAASSFSQLYLQTAVTISLALLILYRHPTIHFMSFFRIITWELVFFPCLVRIFKQLHITISLLIAHTLPTLQYILRPFFVSQLPQFYFHHIKSNTKRQVAFLKKSDP